MQAVVYSIRYEHKQNATLLLVIKSWRDNWERLTEYFQYTPAIRKLIYTTNTVEGYHRQVRKVTKTKGSWRDNWERLTEYFQYTPAIRKLIYTTNTVEGYHRQVRKVTKTKGFFPTDNSLEKLVYLAYRNIRKKWTMPLANWGQISQQLAIKFGDRFKIM